MSMNPSEIEALIEAKVNAKFQMIFQVLGGSQPKTEWVDSNKAAAALGLPKKTLYKAISSGLLRLGTDKKELEVRDRRLPGSKHPRYQFHIANCQKRLSENPIKRF